MGGKLLILCSFTSTALFPQDAQDRDLLLRIRDKLMETVDRLPKYLCTQTVNRSEYKPTSGEVISSCDQLLGKRKSPNWKLALSSSDRLRLDVAVSADDGIYSWAGENRFDDLDLPDLVPHGAISTGSLGSLLIMIFRNDETSFSYNGETSDGGRTLLEFGFRTPLERSHYYFASVGSA